MRLNGSHGRMKLRLKELRDARGWSQTDLAERVGGMDKHKVSRIENGDTKLDIDLALKISSALEVSLGELLGLDEAVTGLAEDAAMYDPGPGEPLRGLADPARGQSLYVVKSRALDMLGIEPGHVLQVSMTPEAVKNMAPLSIVIAQLYDPDPEVMRATTVIRQFVPPALLITNSRDENAAPLNMNALDIAIKGVVTYRHAAVPGGMT
jgi:transcriptional regulator with XRE-family HTH domain